MTYISNSKNNGVTKKTSAYLNAISKSPTSDSEKLDNLKCKYSDIFKEHESLPSSRGFFDHRIPLQEGTNPGISNLTGILLNRGISLSK